MNTTNKLLFKNGRRTHWVEKDAFSDKTKDSGGFTYADRLARQGWKEVKSGDKVIPTHKLESIKKEPKKDIPVDTF